jgi:hypothetical protein
MFWLILLTVIILAELAFYPRLDFTNGKILLWYGLRKRKFVVLWDYNK